MWTLIFVFFLIIKPESIEGLLCYQCSMKYSNEECNANNSTYATECQPSFDTCVTIVLKPAILNQLLITKYCTKRVACERQSDYIHSMTPCQPNNEGRSWGCVTCCGDRDLCNSDHSMSLRANWKILFVFFSFSLVISRVQFLFTI